MFFLNPRSHTVQWSSKLLLLLIFILLRKAKRAMVPNSMEANFKRERATGRERERKRERERERERERGGGGEGGREMISNFVASTERFCSVNRVRLDILAHNRLMCFRLRLYQGQRNSITAQDVSFYHQHVKKLKLSVPIVSCDHNFKPPGMVVENGRLQCNTDTDHEGCVHHCTRCPRIHTHTQ